MIRAYVWKFTLEDVIFPWMVDLIDPELPGGKLVVDGWRSEYCTWTEALEAAEQALCRHAPKPEFLPRCAGSGRQTKIRTLGPNKSYKVYACRGCEASYPRGVVPEHAPLGDLTESID